MRNGANVTSGIFFRDYFAEYEGWLKRRRRLYWLLSFLLFLAAAYLVVYFTVIWQGRIKNNGMHMGMFSMCFFVAVFYRLREHVAEERPRRQTPYEKACNAFHASQIGMKPEEFRAFINSQLNQEERYFTEICGKHTHMTKDFVQVGRNVIWADEILLIYYKEQVQERNVLIGSLHNWSALAYDTRSVYQICLYTKPFGEIPVVDLKRLKIGGSGDSRKVEARREIMLALSDLYPKAVMGQAQSPGGVNLKLWNWAIRVHDEFVKSI